MDLRAGTSGWAYRAWKGSVYPRDLPDARMLGFYASRFDTVELNHTFHRIPTAASLARWAAQTPPGFLFAVKTPQRITHVEQIDPASTALGAFLDALAGLGDRLGAVLFQLPPRLHADPPRLRAFLARLPPSLDAAFEFRHSSWFADAVLQTLADRGIALCLAESDDASTPVVATAPFGYLRLRREATTRADLERWVRVIAKQPWRRAFAYLKHEDAGLGAQRAQDLAELWRRRPEAEAPTVST